MGRNQDALGLREARQDFLAAGMFLRLRLQQDRTDVEQMQGLEWASWLGTWGAWLRAGAKRSRDHGQREGREP